MSNISSSLSNSLNPLTNRSSSSVSIPGKQANESNIQASPEFFTDKSQTQLRELIDKVNKELEAKQTHIKVQIHEKTNTIMVKVISNETNATIREIPSEKMLDFVYDMCLRAGIIIDEKR